MHKGYIGSHADDYRMTTKMTAKMTTCKKTSPGSHFGSHWMTTRKQASVVALEGVNGVNEKKSSRTPVTDIFIGEFTGILFQLYIILRIFE